MSTIKKGIRNTRRLQIYSLSTFMMEEYEAIFCGNGYHDGQNFIPFDEAVLRYNTKEGDIPKGVGLEKVHLVLSKKDKKIICKQHLVKLHPRLREFIAELGSKDVFSFLKKVNLAQ